MSRIQEILRRIGAGEQAAAAEFFREYQPHVRKVIRARMRAAGVTSRRVSDSSDLCQAVLAGFLVQSAVGRYHLDDSEAVRKLLSKIAARRVIDLVRRPEFRRPVPDVAGVGAVGFEPAAYGLSPGSQVALHELIEKADRLLTGDERVIAGMRQDGMTWEEIGQQQGKSAEAVRKSLDRAARRILLALGMGGPDDE
jgi:RNA polymerase sigma factor (sigma-70 family)